jgi:hypothetical protein
MTAPDERLRVWLETSAVEDQHFDIKQTLDLTSESQRKELLKDLTGIGNGGGGTVAFGIAERVVGSESVVDHVVPLTDRTLLGRLRDTIANAVRPTLRWHAGVVEHPGGGYVLIVDVEPSPLGPYMVDAYKDHRFWRRVQTSTLPMDERMVHDLYAEATRWESHRSQLWSALELPPHSTWSTRPWLTASGIPEHIVGEPFDPAHRAVDDLVFHGGGTDHGRIAGLGDLTSSFGVWADGFVAEGAAEREPGSYPPAAQAVVRLHRNGAIGLGVHLATPHRLDATRALNAQLAYMAQLWALAGVRSAELRIELSGLTRVAANDPTGPFPLPESSQATPHPRISLVDIVAVDDLADAPIRHRLLRRFSDRVANCFGEPRQIVGFDVGPLHVASGPAGGFGALAWLRHDGSFTTQDALVSRTGAVRRPSDLVAIGWWDGGVLLDLDGSAVAALEFATSPALPAAFLPEVVVRPDLAEEDTWRKEEWDPGLAPPLPSRRWSSLPFVAFVTGRALPAREGL